MLAIKAPESLCTKLTRSLVGGIWGAACGAVRPVGQWLMNSWDRVHDSNPNNRGRLPVIVDMVSISVILGLSATTIGTPVVCFFAAGGTLLALQGAYRGSKIGWESETKKMLLEIPEELWVIEKQKTRGNQPENMVVVRREGDRSNNRGNRLMETTKGVIKGIFAGAMMPYVQIMHSILSAKRPLPMFIISGFLNAFALYTGATVFVGPALSLKLLLGIEAALACYGGIKGGYIGYTEDSSQVCDRLWQGGFVRPTKPSSVTIEELDASPAPKTGLSVVVSSSITVSVSTTVNAPVPIVTSAGAAASKRLTPNAVSQDLLGSSKLPGCVWLYQPRKSIHPKPVIAAHAKIDTTRKSAPRIIRAKSLT